MIKLFNPKLLLAVVACLTCGLAASAYSFKSGNVYYNITGSSTVEVTTDTQYSEDWTPGTMPDGLAASYSGYVYVPQTVTYGGKTYTVTGVGHCAFIGSSATTIDLPSTITYIGNLALEGCSQLTTLKCRAETPPTALTRYSIYDWYTIQTIYVPEASINSYSYTSPWSTYRQLYQALPDYDFTYQNLKFAITSSTTAKVVGPAITSPSGSWSIPATANGYNVTEIGNRAFINCSKITSMTISNTVTTIGTYAFYGCSTLATVNLGSGMTRIGPGAFCYCYALKSITLPDNLKTIDSRAFSGSGLTSITIPASVESISEDNPFFSCESLTAITVNNSNANYCSSGGVLFNKSMSKLMSFPPTFTGSYEVPSSVTKICDGAFRISKLSYLTLPARLTSIGSYAISYCPNLVSVNSLAITPPSIYSDSFYSTVNNNGITLTVPKGCKSAYQSADYWKNFTTINEMYYSFKVNGIYYNITGSTVAVTDENSSHNSYSGNVSIPSSVTYGGTTYPVTAIGTTAFANCSNLTSVTIPTSVSAIGQAAFYGCSSLTRVSIPNSVITIGRYAFNYCTALTQVTLSNQLTTIDQFTFQNCTSLQKVTIPPMVRTIAYGAFMDCSSLTRVSIPASVTTIESSAFVNCTSLKSVTCFGTVPPTVVSNSFPSSTIVFVHRDCLNNYVNTSNWSGYTILPRLDNSANATNATASNYEFNSTGDYPWIDDYENYNWFVVSGNQGVPNSTSTMTATIDVPESGGILAFKYKAWGEGTSTIYDKCEFVVDGNIHFTYGARKNNWEEYRCDLSAGTHTLMWKYSKDNSVDPEGDYFAISAVRLYVNDILGISDIEAIAGSTITIPITLNNELVDTTVSSIQAALIYPSDFEFISVTTTDRIIKEDCLVYGVQDVENGKKLTMLCYDKNDINSSMVNGTSGPIFEVKLKIPASSAIGDYQMSLDYGMIILSNRIAVWTNETTATISVATPPDGIMEMPDVEAVAGSVITIPIGLNNGAFDAEVCGIQTALLFPNEFELIDVTPTDRVMDEDNVRFSTTPKDNRTKAMIVAVALDNYPHNAVLSGTSGPIANVRLRVPATASGDYDITLEDNLIIFVDNEIPQYFADDVHATITVTPSQLGDVNGDGDIDVADVTTLIAIILNGTPASLDVADVNNDGDIDVADVTALINAILTGSGN